LEIYYSEINWSNTKLDEAV